MLNLRAYALAGVAAIAWTSAAAAADLLPPPPAIEPPPPLPQIDAGGWYLRGDVGVGVNNAADASVSPNPLAGQLPGEANDNWYNNALSEAALFDLGVGYQVNRWFRTDVTGELRGGSEYSSLEVVNVSGGNFAGYQAADFYRGRLTTALGMWNAYVDMGTFWGVTPWAGAGLGVASNMFSGGSDNGVISQPGGGGTSPSGGVFGNSASLNLAWALMAGLDMNITHNLKLEFGYRYLDYGKFKTGASRCLSGDGTVGSFNVVNCGGSGFTIASKELTSNDFRIGLRYYLDDAPPPPPDVPLVRKY